MHERAPRREHHAVLDDVEEVFQLLIALVVLHELAGVERLGLLQGHEVDVLGTGIVRCVWPLSP